MDRLIKMNNEIGERAAGAYEGYQAAYQGVLEPNTDQL